MARRHRTERGRSYAGCFFYTGKDATKTYYCSYKIEGKTKEFKAGTCTRGMTLSRCNMYRSDLMAGRKESAQDIRKAKAEAKASILSKVFEDYGDAKVSEKFRKADVKYHKDQSMHGSDKSRMKLHILPFFNDADIKTINAAKVDKFKDYLEDKGLAQQTIKHALAHMKRLFTFAGISVKIAMPVVKNTVTEDLTAFQLKRLKKVLLEDKGMVSDTMLLIMNTGMRPVEVVRLTEENVNYERKLIELKERKGGVDTILPMNREAEKILRRGLVFNMTLNFAKEARSLADAAGLPATHRPMYCLRHWYATEMVAQGVDIFTVSRLLGHTDVKTTMRYAEARQKSLVEAVDKIAMVMG